MKNLKIGKISSSGQKQGENTKIVKFPRESGRVGSYDLCMFYLYFCIKCACFIYLLYNPYMSKIK